MQSQLRNDAQPIPEMLDKTKDERITTVTLNPAVDKTLSVSNFVVGGLNRVQHSRLDPGGKGINVAKVLHGFGCHVKICGFVAGENGVLLEKQLLQMGMMTDFLTVAGETRINLKIVDEEKRITTEINDIGFPIRTHDLQMFFKKFEALLKETSILVLGGSIPEGVPSHIYRKLIEMANRKKVRTLLDAEEEALQEGIKGAPYAIKPNLFELEKLVGRKLATEREIMEAGRGCLDAGVSIVVISMGEKGAIVMDSQAAFYARPFPIIPQSTVGAGDSMVASLAYAILEQKPLREMAAWATAAGTLTASKPGTQVCTLQEVQANLHKVQLLEIK